MTAFILKTAVQSADYADYTDFSGGYNQFNPHPNGWQDHPDNLLFNLA